VNFKTLCTFLLMLPVSLTASGQNTGDEPPSKNPLYCNPQEGFCEIPGLSDGLSLEQKQPSKNLQVIYFTDPICSSCWGIEPQLRKLKLEYGDDLEIEYHMGGLLKDWSYNKGGISKPSDVAHHWDDVSIFYDMPIDGDVWLEDPLPSSYPPCIAFIAAQMQDHNKALLFLRTIRELVFLYKKNITKWEYLSMAAEKCGLDAAKMKKDMEGTALLQFNEDLQLAAQMRITGFPTLIIKNKEGKQELMFGSKPYGAFEETIRKLLPGIVKKGYDMGIDALFSLFPSMTAHEFSLLSGISRTEAERQLNEHTQQGKLEKFSTKNGSIWYSFPIKYSK